MKERLFYKLSIFILDRDFKLLKKQKEIVDLKEIILSDYDELMKKQIKMTNCPSVDINGKKQLRGRIGIDRRLSWLST